MTSSAKSSAKAGWRAYFSHDGPHLAYKSIRKFMLRGGLNYYRLHLSSWFWVILMAGVIFWQADGVRFVDGLFSAASAMCQTGMFTYDPQHLSRTSLTIFTLLLFFTNLVTVSLWPVLIRRHHMRQFIAAEYPGHDPLKILKGDFKLEYNALKYLIIIVPLYAIVLQIVAWVIIAINLGIRHFPIFQETGLNKWGFSFIIVISGFANGGFSPLNSSMIEFQNDPVTLLVVAALVLLGNTAYPVMLRFVIWIISKIWRSNETLKYLLKHPRRCYTHLFPAQATRWLIFVLLLFNIIEFVFFIALNWGNQSINTIPKGYRVIVAIFQSIVTRTAGFNAVYLTELDPAMLVLYVAMMYISATPLYVTIRSSSPEAQSIRYGDPDLDKDLEDTRKPSINSPGEDAEVYIERTGDEVIARKPNSIRRQALRLVLKDAFFVFGAIFLITIVQSREVRHNPDFSIFKIVFEVVAAYGTVGLSLGYRDTPWSFSGAFHPISKLMVIGIMILGRHRGLPANIDTAVRLPFQHHNKSNRPDKVREHGREIQEGGPEMRDLDVSAKKQTRLLHRQTGV